MSKMKEAAMTRSDEGKPANLAPVDPVADRRFEGEDEYTTIATEFHYYSAAKLTKDPTTGMTTSAQLLSLKGIPLRYEQRPQEFETNKDGTLMLNSEGKKIPKEDRFYFVFALTAPLLVKVRGSKTEWREAQPGEFVVADVRNGMQAIRSLLPVYPKGTDGKPDTLAFPTLIHDVIVHPLRLDEFQKGKETRKAWRFEFKFKKVGQDKVQGMNLLPPVTPTFEGDDEDTGEPIPF